MAEKTQGEHATADKPHFLSELGHGPIRLQGIPKFPTYEQHRQQILTHMAAVFRSWARYGFVEGISGHISVRDPEFPECIWMNPIGKHFAMLDATDMMCLNISSGTIVGGNRTRAANGPGFLIHSEIHKAHNGVAAICHAHTLAGRAWSVFGKPLEMITQDVCDFYDALAVDNSYGGIVAADEEGRRIAHTLGANSKGAILRNHGLLTVGHTVSEASFLLGLLERSCAIQLQVEAACAGNPSLKKMLIPDEMAQFNAKMAGEKNWLYEEGLPDIEYEIEMAGYQIYQGVERMVIDKEGR